MIIKKLIILDPINEVANSFNFSNKANIITAEGNKKGKTSLLKSLYHSLGLSIKNFPTGWNHNEMMFKIYYEHNGLDGYIIRYNHRFYVSDTKIGLDDKEYSEWLCKLLDINLKLVHKDKEEIIALRTSVYTFPFYVDQDRSWSGELYKRHLGDISHYKNIPFRPIEYLLGCYSENLNDLDQKKSDLKTQLKLLSNQNTALEDLEKSFVKKQVFELTFNEQDVKKEIQTYLALSKRLSSKISGYKSKTYQLRKTLDALLLESQEINKLYENNKSSFKEVNHCKCPTCESELTIEQSIKRIKIKHTEFNIKKHKFDIDAQILALEKEIQNNKNIQLKIDVEYQELLSIANIKNQELTLNQYIEEKANNYSKNNYYKALEELKSNITSIENNIHEIDSEIRKIKNELKKKRSKLEEKFDSLKIAFKKALPNSIINEKSFLNFDAIDGSGASTVQTMFGIYLIYFSLLLEFSKITLPFGIDTIIKDDIDKAGIPSMYKLLEDYLLNKDYQSFTVILKERLDIINHNNYHVIDLSNKARLLSNENYYELQKEFNCILE